MESSDKSIINWELHQKLSKKRKIETEYKQKRKGGKKPNCFKRFVSHMREVFNVLNELRKNGHSPRS